MMKKLYFMRFNLIVALLITIASCTSQKKESDKIQVVRNFHKGLNDADHKLVATVLYDSITIKENISTSTFTKSDYQNWLAWDAVFKPTYKLIEIIEKDGKVITKISKECKRTLFLNGEPVITKEVFEFNDGKITSLEILEHIVFHDEKWNAKKELFVSWIDENHPELNGFIYDQTKKGGENYLKAITLYNSREQ